VKQDTAAYRYIQTPTGETRYSSISVHTDTYR
jgi:hypothetical protein